jgi:hypothetical protein
MSDTDQDTYEVDSDLSDEEFEDRLIDTSLIKTHEECVSILNELDADIAAIQSQIDVYELSTSGRLLPQERTDWAKRATFACAIKRSQRHRVMMRDRELRPKPQPSPKKDQSLQIAKQERLKSEVDDRKEKRALEARRLHLIEADIIQRRTVAHTFMKVAAERLSVEEHKSICDEAKRRVMIEKGNKNHE